MNVPARALAGGSTSPPSGEEPDSCPQSSTELTQRRWELGRCLRVAANLAELLEIAGRTDDYKLVRGLEDRLRADLAAHEPSRSDDR